MYYESGFQKLKSTHREILEGPKSALSLPRLFPSRNHLPLRRLSLQRQALSSSHVHVAATGQAAQLRARLTLLDKYWNELFERHPTLCEDQDSLAEEVYFDESSFTEIETTFMENLAKFEACVGTFRDNA